MKRHINATLLVMSAAIIIIVLYGRFLHYENSRTKKKQAAVEVAAAEDLMREHGVLNRTLLIYEEILDQLEHNKPFDHEALSQAAHIIQDFIENYHEKSEENYIFPLFEKRNVLVGLVKTLRAQHNAGREITSKVLQLSQRDASIDDRKTLIELLKLFIRMYRPHEAREDTELFPALHEILTKEEYEKLGDKLEDDEREVLGEGGFEKAVKQVTEIEKRLGINNLAQFTPKV